MNIYCIESFRSFLFLFLPFCTFYFLLLLIWLRHFLSFIPFDPTPVLLIFCSFWPDSCTFSLLLLTRLLYFWSFAPFDPTPIFYFYCYFWPHALRNYNRSSHYNWDPDHRTVDSRTQYTILYLFSWSPKTLYSQY